MLGPVPAASAVLPLVGGGSTSIFSPLMHVEETAGGKIEKRYSPEGIKPTLLGLDQIERASIMSRGQSVRQLDPSICWRAPVRIPLSVNARNSRPHE